MCSTCERYNRILAASGLPVITQDSGSRYTTTGRKIRFLNWPDPPGVKNAWQWGYDWKLKQWGKMLRGEPRPRGEMWLDNSTRRKLFVALGDGFMWEPDTGHKVLQGTARNWERMDGYGPGGQCASYWMGSFEDSAPAEFKTPAKAEKITGLKFE